MATEPVKAKLRAQYGHDRVSIWLSVRRPKHAGGNMRLVDLVVYRQLAELDEIEVDRPLLADEIIRALLDVSADVAEAELPSEEPKHFVEVQGVRYETEAVPDFASAT